MDAEFKKEQIGTPFVWVGALGGGGGGGSGVSPPKSKCPVHKIKKDAS